MDKEERQMEIEKLKEYSRREDKRLPSLTKDTDIMFLID